MRAQPDPNSSGYTNALLEDINDKFEVILEATRPIPVMQADITALKESMADVQPRQAATEAVVKQMQPTVVATFEEVCNIRVVITGIKEELRDIRQRLEILEEAHKLLERDRTEIDALKERLARVERTVL